MEYNVSKASEFDFEGFYNIRCETKNIQWTGHERKPEKNGLFEWYRRNIECNSKKIYLAKTVNLGETIGYLYLDVSTTKSEAAETSLAVSERFENIGVGTALIRYAIETTIKEYPYIRELISWIAEDNMGSIKLHLKNGYEKTEEEKTTYFKGLKEEKKMIKYRKILR